MKLKIGIASTALPLILATAAVGCGSSDDSSTEGPKKLEVYSWLVTGAEETALNKLFDVMRARVPGVEIVNAAQGRSDQARAELPMRLANGNPPDSFQAIGGADLGEWAVNRSALEPLDTIATEQGWETAFPPGVLDSVRFNGHIYGVPLNLERDNTLFYNKDVFTAAGLTDADIPTTVDQFFTVAEKLKTAGKIPLSVSASGGWTIASHVFEALLVAEGGADYYLNYMNGSATDAADAVMTQTLTDVGRMMDYANPDRATTGWGDAVLNVCNGSAAMLFLPDFTKGQFLQDIADGKCGATTADKIGYVAMQKPGESTFVYVGITFPVTQGAPHHDMAVEFVKAVASKEGQEAFNPTKGSIAARLDADPSKFDTISASTLNDYKTARSVPGYAALTAGKYQEAVNPGLQAFVDPTNPAFKNVDTLTTLLKQNYPIIKP
jgi:glucose/mannose transport system substrate-binding protein